MNGQRFRQIPILLMAILVLAACRSETSERARRVVEADAIHLGIVWPKSSYHEGFEQGVTMAVEEFNAAGGLDGKRAKIHYLDDADTAWNGRVAATQFGDDPEVSFVIGHMSSYVAVPASHLYSFFGLPFMTPSATAIDLTESGLHGIFQSVPNDRQMGWGMATYMADEGYKRVAVIFRDTAYGWGLAKSFQEKARRLGIEVVTSSSFHNADSRSFRAMLQSEWKGIQFDAVFLASDAVGSAVFVKELRASDITVPVFGGDALPYDEFIRAAGAVAEGVTGAMAFHPGDPKQAKAGSFLKRYQERYGVLPNATAAVAYDAVRVVLAAMRQAGTPAPEQVVAALKHLNGYEGVTGLTGFAENGSVTGAPIVIGGIRGGTIEYLGSAQ